MYLITAALLFTFLLKPTQSGFYCHYSTEMALVMVTSNLHTAKYSGQVSALFLPDLLVEVQTPPPPPPRPDISWILEFADFLPTSLIFLLLNFRVVVLWTKSFFLDSVSFSDFIHSRTFN